MEGILGIERRGNRIEITPKLPKEWEGYSAKLKIGGTEHAVRVVRAKGTKTISLEVDGAKVKGNAFDLKDGGSSEIIVKIPA